MENLGTSVLQLTTDSTQLDKGMSDAKKASDDLKAHFADVGKVMLGVGGAVTGVVTGMVVSAANYGDELAKAKERTGLAVDELAKLRFAAEQSGSSFEGLQSGLIKFSKNIDEASRGSKAQKEAFAEMGISLTDVSGKTRPMSDLLKEVADRFANMEDGTQKTAMAMSLFGKGGVELIPTLNEGADGLAAMGEQAAALGLVMSEDATAASEAFNDTMDQVGSAVSGVGIALAEALLPAITPVIAIVRDSIAAFGEWAKEHQGITTAIVAVAAAMAGAGGLLLAIGGVMAIVPTVAGAFAALTGAATLLGTTIVALGPGAIAVALAALVALTYHIAEATGLIDALARKIGDWTGASKAVTAANKDLESSTAKAASVLKDKYGVEIARGNKSLEAWNKEVVETLRQHATHKTAMEDGATAKAKLTIQIGKSEVALKAEKEALDLYNKSAIIAINEAGKLYDGQTKQLEVLGKSKQSWFDVDTALKAEMASVVQAAKDHQTLQDKLDGVNKSAQSVQYETEEMEKDFKSVLLQNPGFKIGEGFDDAGTKAVKMKTDAAASIQSLKDSAGAIFDAMLLKGENVFSSLGSALKGGVLSIGRSIFEDVTAALLGPVKEAFDSFFTGLLESTGVKAFVEKLGKKLGDTIAGVFSDKVADTVGGAVSGGVNVPVPSAGGGGGVGGGGGMGGDVIGGAIGGLISGAITYAGLMRLEGTMNAVEFNTRATRILLTDTMALHWLTMAEIRAVGAELFNHKYLPDIVETLGNQQVTLLERILAAISGAPRYAEGISYVPKTGMAFLHEGERVIPPGVRTDSMNVTLSIGSMSGGAEGARQLAVAIRQNTHGIRDAIQRATGSKRVS